MAWDPGFIHSNVNFMRIGIYLESQDPRTIYSVCTFLFNKWIFVFDYGSIFDIIIRD